MVRKGRTSAGRREEQLEDLSGDEIEVFNERRLGGIDDGEEQDGSSEESSQEEVLGEVNSDSDDDDSNDDDGESSSDADQEKRGPKVDKSLDRIGKDWGNKRSSFFKETEESDSDQSDEEKAADEAAAEEAEARRMKKQLLRNLTSDDFELGSSDEDEKSKKKKKKKKEKKRDNDKRSSAGREEKLERVASQAPELLGLLAEFKSNLETLSNHVAPVLDKAKKSQLPTENGMSYLETKLQTMLTYCINIAFYLYMRSKGESVRDHPVIAELVRVRTVLEKLKPLDAKLKTQIDELIAAGSSSKRASAGSSKASSKRVGGARPNAGDLMDDSASEEEDDDSLDDDDDDDSDVESDEERANGKRSARQQIYKAPKHLVISNSFDQDERSESRNAKRQAQRMRKLKNSEMLRDLTSEFSDRPMEEPSVGSTQADLKNRKIAAERTRYEEENFVRLQETKKEKTERVRREREAEYGLRNSLNELEDFGDLEGLVSRVDRDASYRVNDKARRDQELSKFMAKMAQDEANDARKRKSSKRSGDQNVRVRDPVEMRNNLANRAARESALIDAEQAERAERRARKRAKRDAEERTTVPHGEESALYAAADSSAKKRKSDRKQKYLVPDLQPSAPTTLLSEGAARKANYTILKNHGLKAYKKKEDRNPRVRRRKLYEKKLKARQGQVMTMRTNEGETYSGEASGLRSGLVASRRPGAK